MERSVLRILGKRGRTTIPRPIRTELDFAPGDVLLFESDPPDRVIITRLEVVEPEEAEEPEFTGDIFTQEFHTPSRFRYFPDHLIHFQSVIELSL